MIRDSVYYIVQWRDLERSVEEMQEHEYLDEAMEQYQRLKEDANALSVKLRAEISKVLLPHHLEGNSVKCEQCGKAMYSYGVCGRHIHCECCTIADCSYSAVNLEAEEVREVEETEDVAAMQDVFSPAFFCLDCRPVDWSEGMPWTRHMLDELGETHCMGCGKKL